LGDDGDEDGREEDDNANDDKEFEEGEGCLLYTSDAADE